MRDELYRLQSEQAHLGVMRRFSDACRDDAAFADCLGTFIIRGYYRLFFEPIKGRWVEHPDLLAYLTCKEPFQGLGTTPAIAGLRVKLQPNGKDTYEDLARTLKQESGIDLEKEIAEEQRRANDRLAVVYKNGQIGNGRSSDNIKATQGGTSRAYVVGRLKREAAANPEAKALLDRVQAGEISAHAAALAVGWRKPPDAYKQLVVWWDRADEEQRTSFFEYLAARLKRDHPDLAAEVEAGRMSIWGAAKKAGIVKDPTPYQLLRRAWGKASEKDREHFLAEIETWLARPAA